MRAEKPPRPAFCHRVIFTSVAFSANYDMSTSIRVRCVLFLFTAPLTTSIRASQIPDLIAMVEQARRVSKRRYARNLLRGCWLRSRLGVRTSHPDMKQFAIHIQPRDSALLAISQISR